MGRAESKRKQRSLPEAKRTGKVHKELGFEIPLCNPLDVPKHPDFFVPFPTETLPDSFVPHRSASDNTPQEVKKYDDTNLVFSAGLRRRLEFDRAALKELKAMESESHDRFVASQVDRLDGLSVGVYIGDRKTVRQWLFTEPVISFPPLMFEPMSPDDCRRTARHSRVAWTQPMIFAIYEPPSPSVVDTELFGEVVLFDQTTFQTRFGKNVDLEGRKRFLLQVFVKAADLLLPPRLRVNILFLLVVHAKHAAYVLQEEESFANALLLYIDAIRQLQHPAALLDLVWFAQESGRAFESASLHPNRSKESVAHMRHCAVGAFKGAILDAHHDANLIELNPDWVASSWSWYGMALERAGDSAMAIRAFHWGLALSEGCSNQFKQGLLTELENAHKRSLLSPQEREVSITDRLRRQYAASEEHMNIM
eukprot:1112455-Rhodomonas_salina.1